MQPFINACSWPKAAIPNRDGSTIKLRSGGQGILERVVSQTGIHTQQSSFQLHDISALITRIHTGTISVPHGTISVPF